MQINQKNIFYLLISQKTNHFLEGFSEKQKRIFIKCQQFFIINKTSEMSNDEQQSRKSPLFQKEEGQVAEFWVKESTAGDQDQQSVVKNEFKIERRKSQEEGCDDSDGHHEHAVKNRNKTVVENLMERIRNKRIQSQNLSICSNTQAKINENQYEYDSENQNFDLEKPSKPSYFPTAAVENANSSFSARSLKFARQQQERQDFEPSRTYKSNTSKDFDEAFKRKVAKHILEVSNGGNVNLLNHVISKQSDRLHVYANEIAVWVSMYRIVFKIENQSRQRRMSEEQMTFRIQKCLVEYLNHNIYEKRYRFIKIANGTFRACRIRKCTGDYWLRAFIKKFQKSFLPEVDLPTIMGFKSKRETTRSTKVNLPPSSYYNRKKDYLQRKRYIDLHEASFDHDGAIPNEQNFPPTVQKSIIDKIDRNIESLIKNTFYEKSNELNIDLNSMKKWYVQFGKFDFFNPDIEQYSEESRQVYLLLRKAEKEIVNFVKEAPNIKRLKVYSFACNLINQLGITEFQSQKVFGIWLNGIIDKHCETTYDCVRLRDSDEKQMKNFRSPTSNFPPYQ